MNEYTEVTAENLRFIRGSKGMNQTEIADLLGIPINAISKVEGGKRALSDAEKSLLDLYFFGKMPFEIVNQPQLKNVLELTPMQWRVITIIATKRGMTPSSWIADRIRDYLAYDEQARQTALDLGMPFLPNLQAIEKVAEDETSYPNYSRTSSEGNG
jgi:transcriptional regulator with XRE-family HTH domain